MTTIRARLSLWRRTLAPVAVAALALASTAATCKGARVPTAGAMTATLQNASDVPASRGLSLTFPLDAAGEHVAAIENAGLTYLQQVEIGMSPPGWTTDVALLQVFSRPAVFLSDEPTNHGTTVVGDVNTIESTCGELLTVAMDAPSVESPPSRSLASFGQRTSVGVWLSRLTARSGRVPWTIRADSADCMPVPALGIECFDLGTVAKNLTAALDAEARKAFDPPPGGGSDPEAGVRVADTGGATLCGYVPRLIPGFATAERHARGFAFVFRLDFDVRLQVGGLYAPYHRVAAFVPIAFYFERDFDGVMLTIDPADVGPRSEMVSRIAVQVINPLGTPIDAAVGDAIARDVHTKLVTLLTRPPSGTPFVTSDLMAGFFTRLMGAMPKDFDLVLVPRGQSFHDRLVSPQLVPARDLAGVDLMVLR